MSEQAVSIADTYTNSSLATFRACPRKYELRFNQRLERATEDQREALTVGHVWHMAHDVQAKGGDPYKAIADHAPTLLWVVKLSRMFAAYGWYWKTQALNIVESERSFRTLQGSLPFSTFCDDPVFEGQIDGVVWTADGRRGIVERKTTADSLAADSDYWKKLRLDVQVGIYALAEGASAGNKSRVPDFILYDVARKPTIIPKGLTIKDRQRMRMELDSRGVATHFGEEFNATQLAAPLFETQHEDEHLYGARLTADIGDRPDYYFARREVPRTINDYNGLIKDLDMQVEMIVRTQERSLWFRNPDACHAFGTCEFFSLCSNNVHPARDVPPPEGFRRREHLHPELHQTQPEGKAKSKGNPTNV